MKKKHLFIALLILVFDLLSKYWVHQYLGYGNSTEIIPNFFRIYYLRNTGAAWSILEGQRGFFIVISIVVLIVLFYHMKKETRRLSSLAFALMIAGTLGNLYDRIVYSYVRDMLSFRIFTYEYPVFNVADSSLVIGVALLFLDSLIEERRG